MGLKKRKFALALSTGLPLSKLVIFLILTKFKYNQHLRTIVEHFGDYFKSYMLMTTKFGIFFVNVNLNFVFTFLYQKSSFWSEMFLNGILV